MARDPFANYDAWKLASPYDDMPDPLPREAKCWACGETIGTEDKVTIVAEVKTKDAKGKDVTEEYAKCDSCAEYYSHASSAEDLAFSLGDGDVVVDDDGKYKGGRIQWEEQEPYDPRDDDDMGRYRDDY